MFEEELYAYGRYDDKQPFLPFNKKFNILQFVNGLPKSVSVNGKKYYSEYKDVFNKQFGRSIQLGKGIQLQLGKEKIYMNIKPTGSLEERIRDYEFYIDVFYARSIDIDGNKQILNFDNSEENKKNTENTKNYLLFLKKVAATLDFFGIGYKYSFDDLYQNEKSIINWFIQYVDRRTKTNPNINNTGIYNVNMGYICVGVFAFVNEDGTLDIYNLFGDFYKTKKTKALFTNGIEYEVSPYINLNSKELIKYTNFKKDAVENSIHIMELNEDTSNSIRIFMLEVLKAYDIKPDRKELLDLAKSMQDYIDSNSFLPVIDTINRLQIIKRQTGTLSRADKQELLKLRESEKDNQILCAISILLDNKSDCELYYDNLAKDERDVFNDYPIYSLWQDSDVRLIRA